MSRNPFERFYDTGITVVQYTINDYSGDKVTKELNTFKADVQPYSGGKAYEEYGIELDCQMRMFCGAEDNIDVKNYVKIGGVIYEIVHVAPWNMGLEVMLKRSKQK